MAINCQRFRVWMAIIITCLGINKNNLWFLNLGVATNKIKILYVGCSNSHSCYALVWSLTRLFKLIIIFIYTQTGDNLLPSKPGTSGILLPFKPGTVATVAIFYTFNFLMIFAFCTLILKWTICTFIRI